MELQRANMEIIPFLAPNAFLPPMCNAITKFSLCHKQWLNLGFEASVPKKFAQGVKLLEPLSCFAVSQKLGWTHMRIALRIAVPTHSLLE